jgi:hypothetical protein
VLQCRSILLQPADRKEQGNRRRYEQKYNTNANVHESASASASSSLN